MANAQVRLGVITEVHIVPPGSPPGFWHNPFLFEQAEALFGRAVQRCMDARVDAIAILGDLTHFADPESFARVRRVLETVALPVYVLPGNHDLDTSDRPLGAFQQALDLPNITIAPRTLALTPEIDLSLIGLEPGGGAWGYVGVRSGTATGNDVRLHLVLTHFPGYAMRELLADAGLKHAGDLVNRDPLLDGIAGMPGPLLIVNGHLHVHATIAEGRLLHLSVAALVEPPHDVTILTLGFDDERNPQVTRCAAGLIETPGISLPVLSSREEAWRIVDGVWQSA